MANIVNMNGGGVNYTLNEEQFTGNYWVDGKKIYRKCVYISGDIQGNVNYDLHLSDNDNIIFYSNLMSLTTGTKVAYSSGNGDIGSWISSDNKITFYKRNSKIANAYVIVYYTKTAD